MSTSEPWLTLGHTYADCLSRVTDPAREVYASIDDDEVAGFVIINVQGPFNGYIQTVAVRDSARGTGRGTALVQFAEDRIFRDSPNVFLCVSSFNPRARQLYERLGYEMIGELRDFIVRGHSELLMRKTRGPLKEFTPAP